MTAGQNQVGAVELGCIDDERGDNADVVACVGFNEGDTNPRSAYVFAISVCDHALTPVVIKLLSQDTSVVLVGGGS